MNVVLSFIILAVFFSTGLAYNFFSLGTGTKTVMRERHPCSKSKKVLWFMAVQNINKDVAAHYYKFVVAALNSARSFAPDLVPYIIHPPGSADQIPSSVREIPGVNYLSHNLSFYSQLETNLGPNPMFGAWYRLDIPHIVRTKLAHLNADTFDLDYVLYTDTDVVFFQEFHDCTLPRPKVLAFGGDFKRNKIENSGVLYLNVTAMEELWPETLKFADSKKWKFNGPVDQGLYDDFYKKRATQLPDSFNWKGYWGEPKSPNEPVIGHFHGPKPDGCLECFLMWRKHYKTYCTEPCHPVYIGMLDLVTDGGAMYERMMYAFQNHSSTHHHHGRR